MTVSVHFIYLLFGIIVSQITSLRIPSKSTGFTNIGYSSFRLNAHVDSLMNAGSGIDTAPSLSTGDVLRDELSGPFSADFVKYLTFVKIFQVHLDAMYSKSLKIKCPFFRRRATDSVDGLASVVQFVLARHKSLPIPVLPSGQLIISNSAVKLSGLSVSHVANILEKDWKCKANVGDLTHGKGYYITGKLTREIYQDYCFFDGPDPDMPVTGLKKYISSTSQLFDHKHSRADLISMVTSDEEKTITIKWRLEGILNLPWHPKLKPWTGQTTYFIDNDGLIDRHIESWDISVVDAFVSVLLPFLNYGAQPAPPVVPSIAPSAAH